MVAVVAAAFCDAAVDPACWPEAMEVVSKATNSHGALLVPLDGTRLLFPHTGSMEPSVETYHRDGWNQRDERFRGVDLMMRRGVVTDLDFFTEEAILRHPYYQEFLAPHGLRWFAGVKIACGDVQWALSLQRRIDQGPFNAEEQDTLKALSRQLAGAAAIVRALGLARAESALSAFELSGTAVALVGRTGNVMSVNPAAERLLGQDVYVRLGRLTSRNVAATAALDRALSALLCSPAPVAMLPPIALPRIGRRPILAYPARLSDVTADALGLCQALVVLVDLDSRATPPEAALRGAFGLTEAECRLARRIATGENVEAAAIWLGITYETARNQLKSIFAKTDTHRQAELVAVLTRLLAAREK